MLNWVKNLQENSYRTIIISNMSPETYQELVKEQPWLDSFDEAIISGLIKINKPDPRIYEAAIRKSWRRSPPKSLFPRLMLRRRHRGGKKRWASRAHLFSDTDALLRGVGGQLPHPPRQGLTISTFPRPKTFKRKRATPVVTNKMVASAAAGPK